MTELVYGLNRTRLSGVSFEMRTTLQTWLPQIKRLLGGYKYTYDDTSTSEQVMTTARAMLVRGEKNDSSEDSD
jgi:hypothetical protein